MMEAFAFLHVPVSGAWDDEEIGTDVLEIPKGGVLDHLASAISAGDPMLLAILRDEMVGDNFQWRRCDHEPHEECNALGSAEDLQKALERVRARRAATES